jgi:reversibly glycosylated polypeptide/UDP-arabinopyranose mutase
MKALVIPSNRDAQLQEFFDAWHASGQADWDCVILSEDSDTKRMQPRCPWPLHHTAHDDVYAKLGNDAWIISRGDSARRCFGFLVAAERGAEWILTLDDDCRPVPGAPPICAAHLAAMRSHAVCQPTAGMRTRGLPYRQLGTVESKLNMGLWRGNADVDGPTGLTPQPYFTPPAGSQFANPRLRYPLCGMNLFFHRSLLPALYFPLMGEGQPYRRFDDIWCGWLLQKLAEHCGISWSFGEPFIEHVRASDPFKNLVAEAPGIVVNETIWQRINDVTLSAATACDLALSAAAIELGEALHSLDGYLSTLGRALQVWARLATVEECPSLSA